MTGRADPRLASFDRLMTKFVAEQKIPGAALAVSYHGRLVYARGFGNADLERKTPVKPDSLFRLASVSKPITAVAILKLVEEKKLRLSDRIVDILPYRPHLEPGAKADPRWRDVTVLQVLQHTGGWDRDVSFDPMFRPIVIAKSVGAPSPAGPESIIRYMLGKPLDFTPGERYAYSNFGYCILGRVIEKISGKPYETFVRDRVLEPLGIRDMRIGHTLASQRLPGEVVYYGPKNRTGRSVVGTPGFVPLPYGTWYLEAMDSHGGWVASAPDLVRFASAFDNPAHCPILIAASIKTMFARPAGNAGYDKMGKPKAVFYACGWEVRPIGKTGQANTWHSGSLDGTETLLVRRYDGIDWAVLFNTRENPSGESLVELIDGQLHEAADAVKQWPEGDQFRVIGITNQPR